MAQLSPFHWKLNMLLTHIIAKLPNDKQLLLVILFFEVHFLLFFLKNITVHRDHSVTDSLIEMVVNIKIWLLISLGTVTRENSKNSTIVYLNLENKAKNLQRDYWSGGGRGFFKQRAQTSWEYRMADTTHKTLTVSQISNFNLRRLGLFWIMFFLTKFNMHWKSFMQVKSNLYNTVDISTKSALRF